MATILLRFVTRDEPISFLIRAQTDCAFSHVEFLLDDDWQQALYDRAASLGRAVSYPANNLTLGAHIEGGLALWPRDYAKFSRTEVVAVECLAEQKRAVITSALACVGEEYDVRDIAGIVFHQDWREKGHYICSVFCAEKLINNGVQVLRVTDKMASITPRDLYMSPKFYTVPLP